MNKFFVSFILLTIMLSISSTATASGKADKIVVCKIGFKLLSKKFKALEEKIQETSSLQNQEEEKETEALLEKGKALIDRGEKIISNSIGDAEYNELSEINKELYETGMKLQKSFQKNK